MATTIENEMRAKQGLDVRMACPDCGDAGPHETNGDKLDPAFCCAGCGMHHDVRADDVGCSCGWAYGEKVGALDRCDPCNVVAAR